MVTEKVMALKSKVEAEGKHTEHSITKLFLAKKKKKPTKKSIQGSLAKDSSPKTVLARSSVVLKILTAIS